LCDVLIGFRPAEMGRIARQNVGMCGLSHRAAQSSLGRCRCRNESGSGTL
jgi:hypothetical protein